MSEQPAEAQPDLWTQVLDFLSRVITPDWDDMIALIPLGLLLLVLLVVFGLIPWLWMRWLPVNKPRVAKRTVGVAPPAGVHLPGPSLWPFVFPVGAALFLLALVLRPVDERGEPTEVVNWPLFVAGLLLLGVGAAGWFRDAMEEWRSKETLALRGEAIPLAPGVVVTGLPADTGRVHPSRALVPAVHGALVPSAGVPAAETVALEPPPGVHLPGPSPWPFFAPVGLAVVLFGLVFHPVIAVAGVLMSLIAALGWFFDAGREYRQVEAGHHAEPRTRDPAQAFPRAIVAIYGLIFAAALVVMFIPGIVAFANPGGPPTSGGPGGPPPPPSAGAPADAVAIAADALAFDKDRLEVPADTPFTIEFDNREAVPHNVAIFLDEGLGQPHFTGEIIDGPSQITYEVEPLPAGEYPFICSVHPNMRGTVAAR